MVDTHFDQLLLVAIADGVNHLAMIVPGLAEQRRISERIKPNGVRFKCKLFNRFGKVGVFAS